jgi:hypothetical protein
MNEAINPEPSGIVRGPNQMLELDRSECLDLLASASIGRIAVTVPDWAQPVIRPVNYLFDKSSQSVLIRSGIDSKLHAVMRSANAAFEVDETDPANRIGWSVIIHGVCEEITTPSAPWAPGHKGRWIRIRTNTVSGRRLVAVRHGRA